MFGESALTAFRGASPRLLLWCRAFDEWLAERRRLYTPSCYNKGLVAWRRLYRQSRDMPWELRPAGIAAHVESMREQGFSPNTVNGELGAIDLFYRWCSEKRLDPDCEPYFNPAASVPRPVVRQYEGTALLSRGEVGALLAVLRADRSPLGLRDHAFYLARLQLGVPFRQLQRLQWGQIQVAEAGASVIWLPGAEPARLPDDVWDAIHAFLEGAGRLSAMEAETYIFAPLADPTAPQVDLGPGDWDGSRYLSTQQLRANLKRYGRLAGIPEGKLEQHALRRTAARLRLASGDSLERVQSFLGSRSAPRLADYRLNLLPPLPDDPPSSEQAHEIVLPNRQPHRIQSSDVYVHGFYARSQPLEAVRAVIAENIQGLEEQITALRALGRGLLQGQEHPPGEAALQLGSVYGQVAGWLAELVRIEDDLDEIERERKKSVIIIDVFESENTGESDLDLASRLLEEEIASLRLVLRNTILAAVQAGDMETYVRRVQLYGIGSVRLAHLLKREAVARGQMQSTAEMRGLWEALREAHKAWGREPSPNAPTFEQWVKLMWGGRGKSRRSRLGR
jgi:site-specific recombinase XerD